MTEVDVVLSASSTKFPAHVGYLMALQKMGLVPARMAVCSGGAIVGGLYAAGIPLEELEKQLLKINFESLVNDSFCSKLRLARVGYLSRGKGFRKLLKKMVGDVKLKDIEMPLYIMASNYSTNDLEIFSQEAHPDLELYKAIYMSATLPGVFKPMKYKGDSYRDGGIHKFFPWDIWEDKPRPRVGHLIGYENYSFIDEDWGGFCELEAFIHNACFANMNEALRDGPGKPEGVVTFSKGLDSDGEVISPLRFDLTIADKQKLLNEGFENAQETLSNIV